jgi:hypothetical protein
MRVVCRKCNAEIDVTQTSIIPLRWGTNDLPTISGICHAVRNGTSVIDRHGQFNCAELNESVLAALQPNLPIDPAGPAYK